MWLLKTEPSTYAYDDLERDKRATWDGVKNPVALRNLREMKEGDAALIYHTGDEKAVVGTALVVREAYPDPKSKDPRLVVVDLTPGGPAIPAHHAGRDQAAPRLRGQPAPAAGAAVRRPAHERAVERAYESDNEKIEVGAGSVGQLLPSTNGLTCSASQAR